MSNKIGIFFCLFLCWIPSIGADLLYTEIDSIQKQAKYLFDYERYPDAIELYEGLLHQGYFQEDMLYRLAFMYEQLDQYPESIYALRKLQWEIGGSHIDAKIEQLMDEISRERLSVGENWTNYQLWIHRNSTLLISLLLAAVLLASFTLLLPYKQWKIILGVFFSCLILGLGGIWAEQQLSHKPKGVIMERSAYYDLPGYAASYRPLPIAPGATVSILQTQDIWCQISMGQFQTWVPKFVIREI